jgi:rRNA maturation endonuclease Nob1
MLLYIIDGFNLLHKISSLKKSANPQRDLILYIKKYKLTGSANNKVIIVFDGRPDLQAAKERDFEVIFSLDKSADEVIKKKLSIIKNKAMVAVVSDDREIRDYAKSLKINTMHIADFLKIKKRGERKEEEKEIDYALQREITEELRKTWLKE